MRTGRTAQVDPIVVQIGIQVMSQTGKNVVFNLKILLVFCI